MIGKGRRDTALSAINLTASMLCTTSMQGIPRACHAATLHESDMTRFFFCFFFFLLRWMTINKSAMCKGTLANYF